LQVKCGKGWGDVNSCGDDLIGLTDLFAFLSLGLAVVYFGNCIRNGCVGPLQQFLLVHAKHGIGISDYSFSCITQLKPHTGMPYKGVTQR